MRYREIDIFKGILTILMVLAHCLQFFIMLQPGMWQHTLSEYINLTTFSGFLFAFGFSAWYAYISKPYATAAPRVLKNIGKMLAAYYISAFGFRIFIEGVPLNQKSFLNVLLFRSLAGWSEFLLSFAALMVLILCFQPLMKKAGKYLAPAIAVIAVIACVVPVPVRNAVAATFTGQADFAVFAVVPYCLYFAFGVLVAQHEGKINRGLIAAACLETAVFFAVLFLNGTPSRFPLSLPWLLGALGFVCLYYRVSGWLTAFPCATFLEGIGKNSLFYLLLSNLFIFAVKSTRFFKLDTFYAFAFFVVIMAVIYYFGNMVAGARTNRSRPERTA